MKMFAVVYVDYLDETVTDAFKRAGCKSYMKFHDLTGEDESYEPMTGTHGSPGKLKSLFVHVPDKEVPHFLAIVKDLKQRYPVAGFRAFAFPIEEYCL